MSKQEKIIYELLKTNNYNFLYDEPFFTDLLTSNGGIARYDFIILNENKVPIRLIEIDGEQHYRSIKIFGGDKAFQERQKMDEKKNNYAKNKGIPLIRIPYTLKENITLDDIFSSKYLI